MQMIHIFSAAPFAPLLASIFVGLFGKYFGKGFSHTTTILGVGVAFVVLPPDTSGATSVAVTAVAAGSAEIFTSAMLLLLK